MSAELVGILSVGATLVVGGLATAGAVVGLILRLESRLSARMGAMDERLSARMDSMDQRLSARMGTFEARQYETVQTVARMEATQQAMLATLARIEERSRPAGDPPAKPTLFEPGPPPAEPADGPRQSVPASAPTPA